MLKSDSIGRKSKQTLLVLKIFLLFLQWFTILCVKLGLLNVDKQTANTELKAENPNNFLGNKRAIGGKRVKIIEGVYLTLCLRHIEILQPLSI